MNTVTNPAYRVRAFVYDTNANSVREINVASDDKDKISHQTEELIQLALCGVRTMEGRVDRL